MLTKNTLVWTIVAFILIAPATASAQIKLTWEVLRYDIDVSLPSDMNTTREADISATLELRNQSDAPFDRITLRISDAASVAEITSEGSRIEFSTAEEKITESKKLQQLRLRVKPVAAGAKVVVAVRYKLAVSANSGLIALSPVGSQFLPLSFWYPTPTTWFFSEGGDFAPFDINVRGADGLEVVSAGSLDGAKISSPLKGTPFFVTGSWIATKNADVTVYAPASEHVAPGRAEEMAAFANEAKAFTEKALGKKIAVPIKIVSVSRGSGFSDSGVVLVERGAFMSKKLDAKAAGTISESVVKTLLGNVLAVRGSGYGAIREGMSRFISNNFLEQKYGAAVAEIIRLRQISNYSVIVDKDGPLSLVSPVDGYYYSANANKGSMIWHFLDNTMGPDFLEIVRSDAEDGNLSLSELRQSFSSRKDFLDYSFDQVTLLNLMIGNPVADSGVTKAALRNLGEFDVDVRVDATDISGKKYTVNLKVPAKGFSEARFETQAKIVRVELDPDKLYPQTSYFDDVAPRRIRDDDPLIFVKKEFDRQEYAAASQNAEAVLQRYPGFDEARVFLARSYLALDRITDAKLEFEKVLKADLPSPQGLAWSLVGLGDAARKTGQASLARQFYDETIWSDGDYGASLSARRSRRSLGSGADAPEDVKQFFAGFDRAVIANSKREVEAFILNGEVARFASNVAGQAQEWQTTIIAVDQIDKVTVSVEADVTLKLLNREVESGLAVFRLSRVAGQMRLVGVEVFEVR